jgi:hypothetical protein
MRYYHFLLIAALFCTSLAVAQDEYIHTKEGSRVLKRRQVVFDCLRSLKKDRTDKTALTICECQADQLERRFTLKQYEKHTKENVIDLAGLFASNNGAQKDLEACITASGKSILLQAQGAEGSFLEACRKSIQGSSDKTFDANRVDQFCQCQLQLVRSKKLSDAEMKTLSNPNSLLFFEMMYRCGDPFADKESTGQPWTSAAAADVTGPEADTISVLPLNGMTYVKVKTGSLVQVWLFDTGASDLLINTETEATLKKEGVLTDSNYLGVGQYQMANGTIDSCRRYRVNGMQIGRFTVNNVVVAVNEKGKRIIVGKSLLNKFRRWSLDNGTNKLLLAK